MFVERYNGVNNIAKYPPMIIRCCFFGGLLQEALQLDKCKESFSKEEFLRGKASELELVAEVREIADGSPLVILSER